MFDVGDNNYLIESSDYILGMYKTKERALEVLDEIQEFMTVDKDHYEGIEKVSYQDCRVYKADDIMIYEMPKE